MLPPDTEVMWVTWEDARVAEEADQAEVIQARPEPASGKGEPNLFHGRLKRRAASQAWDMAVDSRVHRNVATSIAGPDTHTRLKARST